jgi:hypothetical protein
MKKFTFMLSLLVTAIGFSQQQQYVLGFEPSSPSGTLSNWIAFDPPNPGLSIVTNPDPDGVNTSATTKVMKVDLVQQSVCYAGLINSHGSLGSWKFDTAVPNNLSVSVQVNKSFVGKVGIKFATPTNGTVIESTTNEGSVNTVNEWITYSWNISTLNNAEQTAGGNDQFVFFVDFTCGDPNRTAGGTILFDNVTWNANKLTDPATCSDGIRNGSETGIDCGGSNCSPCSGQTPLIAAPIPPVRIATDVVSIYSNAYSNVSLAELPTGWSQLGAFTPILIAGDNTWKIDACDFLGMVTNYGSGVNISAMEKMHIDYWTLDTNPISVKIVNTTSGTTEAIAPLGTTITGTWKSVDIDMTAFTGNLTDKTKITQILIDPSAPSNLYIDNFYFWKQPLATQNFSASKIKMYPNPATNMLNIEALNEIENISVYNLLGQEVISKTTNNKVVNLDIASINSGIYIIKTTIDGVVSASRFVKE